MDRIEYCYKQLNDKQELIRRTDAKASSVIVIVSFATSAFIALLFRIDVTWQRHLAGTLFCCLIAALLFFDIVFVLVPRFKFEYPIGENKLQEYRDSINNMSDDDLFEQLTARILQLNDMLEKKNKYLKVVFLLLMSLAVLLFFVVFCAVF